MFAKKRRELLQKRDPSDFAKFVSDKYENMGASKSASSSSGSSPTSTPSSSSKKPDILPTRRVRRMRGPGRVIEERPKSPERPSLHNLLRIRDQSQK